MIEQEITPVTVHTNQKVGHQFGLYSYDETLTLCKLRPGYHIVKSWNRTLEVCEYVM